MVSGMQRVHLNLLMVIMTVLLWLRDARYPNEMSEEMGERKKV